MSLRRLSLSAAAIAAVLLFSTACASTTKEADTDTADTPALVEAMPTSVESFDLEGYKPFANGADGYSVRYSNPRKKRLADVYVYPVSEENQTLEHEKLVLGSTRATIQAIGEAVRQGVYANFNVVHAGTQLHGARTVARVQATYLRQNLASFTLVYQTEHEGTLMKIRVSMPDNESNRASGEWDTFAEKMFALIIERIDNDTLLIAEDSDSRA